MQNNIKQGKKPAADDGDVVWGVMHGELMHRGAQEKRKGQEDVWREDL